MVGCGNNLSEPGIGLSEVEDPKKYSRAVQEIGVHTNGGRTDFFYVKDLADRINKEVDYYEKVGMPRSNSVVGAFGRALYRVSGRVLSIDGEYAKAKKVARALKGVRVAPKEKLLELKRFLKVAAKEAKENL